MTIACTRCGAQADGEIISPPIAFTFKHNSGCGHGVGPLAVLPGSKPKKEKSVVDVFAEKVGKSFDEITKDAKDVIIKDEDVVRRIEDVIVEESPKKSKSKIEKLKVFGKKD